MPKKYLYEISYRMRAIESSKQRNSLKAAMEEVEYLKSTKRLRDITVTRISITERDKVILKEELPLTVDTCFPCGQEWNSDVHNLQDDPGNCHFCDTPLVRRIVTR